MEIEKKFMIAFLIFFYCLNKSLVSSSPLRKLASAPTPPGAFSPLPLPASGSCTKGTSYTINSVIDLYSRLDELECIFSAGVSPDDVPLGFSYGYLLSAANSAALDILAEAVYQGDYVVKTQCGGKFLNIGWMSIAGVKPGTAVWSIGDAEAALKTGLAPGEYPLPSNRPAIIMDFTVDLNKLCAAQGNESPLGLIGFSPFANSLWPIKQFVDIAVIVGRDANDGGLITLNKAYITNAQLGAQTALIYATKNFDPAVKPGFASGTPIVVPAGPNNENVITFNRLGLSSLIERLNWLAIIENIRETSNPVLPSRTDAELKKKGT